MYYQFRDENENIMAEHSNKNELLRVMRVYYKGLACEEGDNEYEVIGIIDTVNQFGDITSSEDYYHTGNIDQTRITSPYQQGEFI